MEESSAHRRKRLLLAEDDPQLSRALVRLLSADFDVVGIVSDGHRLIKDARQLQPDVIVADVALQNLDGISATLQIHSLLPRMPVVLITALDVLLFTPVAFAAGAVAFLDTMQGAELLVAMLHKVLHDTGSPPS